MQLVDTHVHINFAAFQDDLYEVASRWRDAGVVNLVHSCVDPSEFVHIQALANQFPEISFAVGLHPLDAVKWEDSVREQILALIRSDSRVVAVGETGLDFYKSDQAVEQYQAFTAQLQLARSLNLPVIIHCRDAAAPMAEFLRDFWISCGSVAGVMHCWGGTPEETKWFLDLGFYISFSGTVTFKKAEQIQASAKMVPSDRLLIETDCPFLAPVPKRGKRNEPAFVRYVAQHVAQLRNVPVNILAKQTVCNAYKLFSIALP